MTESDSKIPQRKIIHVDMDCFYAAVEIRDNPSLRNKAVAVGGSADKRGVICTCNYLARQYGVHSAMPTAKAYRYCKNLVVLPVNMGKYIEVSRHISAIFHELTDKIEPLSLDEAYLDVTGIKYFRGSATWMAEAILKKIWATERITASAGVAPNKFLAKIASAWHKPNGLVVLPPEKIPAFLKDLPVNKLPGVGQVRAKQLSEQGIITCADLQKQSLSMLLKHFGKMGLRLYEQARGIDESPVCTDRIRKSLSVETTLDKNVEGLEACATIMDSLYHRLARRLKDSAENRVIKAQFIKIKFADFRLISTEEKSQFLSPSHYHALLLKAYPDSNPPVRLLGLGVSFLDDEDTAKRYGQQLLFDDF